MNENFPYERSIEVIACSIRSNTSKAGEPTQTLTNYSLKNIAS